MVTLRRDVAAMNRNEKTFDRRSDGLLTEYDRFMLAKKQAEAERAACDYGFVSARQPETKRFNPKSSGKIDINYFGLPNDEVPETKMQATSVKQSYSSYDEYMEAQLRRTAPGKILSKSEFAEVYGKAPASVAVKESVKRGLSKKAKIFVAAYVLIVAIIASVIMLVDTNASGTQEVGAAPESGYTAQGELNSLSDIVVYGEGAK